MNSSIITSTRIVSIALIVGGFIVSPTGVIDGSVLTAVGLLLMFAVIKKIPEAVKGSKSVKISKGDLNISVSSDVTQQ